MPIKILPPELKNQIAAGEVIDRPASVVKEFVENAIDAQADLIKVLVDKGGRDKIAVIDNGTGMSPEDAEIAAKRYSTSKISQFDDLNRIKTFGFRGEALASIASISRFTLKTKKAGSSEGIQINNDFSSEPCAHPQGTTVIAEDLFYNTPARRKFLGTQRTEIKYVKNYLIAQSIANHRLGFILRHNDRATFNFPPDQTFKERISLVLNIELEDYMEVDFKGDYFNLQGFIGMPQEASEHQKKQYIFVNNRYLHNKTIVSAIYSAFKDILPRSINPPFIVKLNIREDLIDVNVHPRKEEIKFVSPSSVFNTLKGAVESALSQKLEQENMMPSLSSNDFFEEKNSLKDSSSKPVKQSFQKDFLTNLKDIPFQSYQVDDSPTVFQIDNLYLIVLRKKTIDIYDQHAAEERILFEKFKQQYKQQQQKDQKQKLLFIQVLELNREQTQILTRHLHILERIGFEIKIKNTTVKISAVPVVLQDKDIKQIIKQFIDDLNNPSDDISFKKQSLELKIDRETLRTLHYLSCRSAIKKGDRLPLKKRQQIVEKIKQLGKKGLTCPHGRPTKITITSKQLGKKFKRT